MKNKKQTDGDRQIKICPNCGSPEIEYASLETASGEAMIGLPEKYYCPNCSYEGSIILEVNAGERLPKHQTAWNREPKNQLQDYELKHLAREKYAAADHEYADVLRPVFVAALIAFFITTALLLVPRETQYPAREVFQNITALGSFSAVPILLTPSTALIQTSEGPRIVEFHSSEAGMENVQRQTGISQVTGFLFPLFAFFLSISLLVALTYTHAKRAAHFK